MKNNCVVCHYDEIGLKGENRDFFERRLIYNLQDKINQNKLERKININKIFGRLILKLNNFLDEDSNKLHNILETSFGVANFGFAYESKFEIKQIIADAYKLAQSEEFSSFRITTIRTDKTFRLTSREVNEQVGSEIYEKLNKKVDLEKPDLNCRIEIVDKQVFIYVSKEQGPGGLPVGVSGKAIALLSGGIDSPVAAWYGAKRGLEVIPLHFHSYPQTSKDSINKVIKLAKQIQPYSMNREVYLCAFLEIQKKIYSVVPDKFRIIFYRRFMMQIAQEFAKMNQAKALITGEALGQVASQTIENMTATSQNINLLTLRPLIGFDKNDIINQARKINTYNISIEPHDDCCVVYMPKYPETRANLDDIMKIEKKLDINNEILAAVGKIEKHKLD